jgi:hypothetical protein
MKTRRAAEQAALRLRTPRLKVRDQALEEKLYEQKRTV